jgi:cytochrome c oxidase assembly protein subunit 15
MRAVKTWLWIGIIMILIQVLLGGITRLTGSGLSITEWDLIMGAVPPLNEQQWNTAFEKYKEFPQYKLINQDMTMAGFKKIFFWEYLHRNWARLIGFVFIIPFVVFLFQKKISKSLGKKLLLIFFLGGLQGLMGWLMVKSGLIEKPWVSPYNLTMHLLLALLLFSVMLWLVFSLRQKAESEEHPVANKGIKWVLALVVLQILFGGFMAGTKAGLTYTTYPLMGGKIFPEQFFLYPSFISNLFENTTAINFIHRTLAVFVVLGILVFGLQNIRYASSTIRKGIIILLLIVSMQFLLGVVTLLSGSSGEISVTLGVMHQLTAFILVGVCIFILYHTKQRLNTATS